MAAYHTSLGIWTELESTFRVLNSHLEELGFDHQDAAQYKIFCTSDDAVEFFKYPHKTHWNGIEIVVVPKYPHYMCSVVRSTEYTENANG